MAKNAVAVIEKLDNVPTLALPSGFTDLPQDIAADVTTPYVQFTYTVSKNYGELLVKFQSQMEDGDAVLILPKPYEPILLQPFRYFVMKLTEFWGIYDKAKGLTTVSRSSLPYDEGWRRTFDTVLLVIPPSEDKLIPATCRFKSITSAGGKVMFEAIQAAREWDKNPKHRAICEKVQNPECRVFAHAEIRPNKNDQPILMCQAHPITEKYQALVHNFVFGPNREVNLALYGEVVKSYDRRLKDAWKKIVKAQAVAA